MKIRRSLTHREFNVRSAGWFTVLKPDGWFPALRLPDRFPYRSSQSAETTAVDHAGGRRTTNSPRIMIPSTKDRNLVHLALVVLTAMRSHPLFCGG